MYTEEEMKAKICWHTIGEDVHENCFGSACAAWRWVKWVEPGSADASATPIGYGYCGLAGNP